MKKVLFILGAAALVLASCAKSETVVKETTPGEISFKAVAGAMTKGAELTGNHLFTNYSIYAAATQKNASGVIENPSFFSTSTEMQFKNGNESADPAVAVAADTPWHGNTLVYWPLGGVKMDFLAYAMPIAKHADIATSAAAATVWKAYWNDANTDVAKTLSFNGVDTYANQVDVLYAVANDRTSANSGETKYVPMTFNHAQALLIFNVKRNTLTPLPDLQIDEIEFVTDARVKALQAGVAAHTPLTDSDIATDDVVTLKTVGTFTVDNSRNTLVATWNPIASKKENWNMPHGVAGNKSDSNLADVLDAKQLYSANIPYNAKYAQLGETLLIPEQPKVNFTMKYTLGDNTYYFTFNDLRGVWEKGKKYIYNIDIDLQEIIITETVEDFFEALTHTVPPAAPGTGDVPLS